MPILFTFNGLEPSPHFDLILPINSLSIILESRFLQPFTASYSSSDTMRVSVNSKGVSLQVVLLMLILS